MSNKGSNSNEPSNNESNSNEPSNNESNSNEPSDKEFSPSSPPPQSPPQQSNTLSSPIARKIMADFTLFNLNDPQTTKFYASNIDYFINNFPYFKDLKTVSSIFTGENKKFNSKFITRITKFMEIIEYDSSKDDHNENKATSPPLLENTLASLKLTNSQTNSLVSIKNIPDFPNHFPSGIDFCVNPTVTVMKYYSKILIFHSSKLIVTPPFFSKIIYKIEYEDISNLICLLIKNNTIKMEVLIRSGLIHKIKDVSILETILNNQENEERVMEEVYKMKDGLIGSFLESIDKTNMNLVDNLYNVLVLISNHKPNLPFPEISLSSFLLCRIWLYYLRLLSYNESFSEEILLQIIDLFFEHKNCTHLLISISKILLRVDSCVLVRLGFFNRVETVVKSYFKEYLVSNVCDSILPFIIKVYAKHRQNSKMDILEYFIKIEKFGYKKEDLKMVEEIEGFERFVLDCFLSEIPYSSVFEE